MVSDLLWWADRNIDSMGPNTREDDRDEPRQLGRPRQPRHRYPPAAPARRALPGREGSVASPAEHNDAPRELVEKVRNADTQRFNGPDEVLQALKGR